MFVFEFPALIFPPARQACNNYAHAQIYTLSREKRGELPLQETMSEIAGRGREGEPDRSGEGYSSPSESSSTQKMAEGRIVRGSRRKKPFVGVHWLG